ncbi:hypothetical protein BDK51DRAFT_29226 [Blyttiomyces helicus]|uniref:Pentacotripeptide-repeat region of PRORP domain-containing protein n=1 Tax=Blyttiomyces helicus TaxID=388810 RepID=A0A4V1IPM4_9FUNG|nr:hypothetical protein BDK51DRAFT_29226 [Blyttiomyces helicus]|eukprot:RKO83567.1 hypothetical protein BDK51DRAFT_29226 [Blyttiomyces helicus]
MAHLCDLFPVTLERLRLKLRKRDIDLLCRKLADYDPVRALEALTLLTRSIKRIPRADVGVAAYNHTIRGLLREPATYPDAYTLYSRMVERGPPPDLLTYKAIIEGFVRDGRMREAEDALAHMLKAGLEPEIFTLNSIADGHFKAGDDIEAVAALARIPHPDTYTVGIGMRGLTRAGRLDDAVRLVENALGNGVEVNEVARNTLLQEFGRAGRGEEAMAILARLGHGPSSARAVAAFMEMEILRGNVDAARALFDDLSHRGAADAVTYNIMIKAYFKHDRAYLATALFDAMDAGRETPLSTSATYAILISNAANSGDLAAAERLLKTAKARGLELTRSHFIPLIAAARADPALAVRYFRNMQFEQIVPDDRAHAAVLAAFTAAGDFTPAQDWIDTSAPARL